MNFEDVKQECINVIELYDIGQFLELIPISSGFANLNFKLVTSKDRFLYRISTQQNTEMVLYEFSLMEILKKEEFLTAYIIERKDGNKRTSSPKGDIVIYEFKDGNEPEINNETCREIAKGISKLNSIEGWNLLQKENAVSIKNAKNLISTFKFSINKYDDIYTFFTEETNALYDALQIEVPKGFVHGDAFPDNTLFNGNVLSAIVDFEEACVDNLLFDIGITVNGFCIINNRLDFELFETFILEYNKTRLITDKEFELLHFYIRWGALAMVYWHLKNDLRNIIHEEQHARVLELIDRIKHYHSISKQLKKNIKDIQKKVSL